MQSGNGAFRKMVTTYLFVGEAQLVLQDCFAIDQQLNFIGESVEGLGQSLAWMWTIHPSDAIGEAGSSLLNGVGMNSSAPAELG